MSNYNDRLLMHMVRDGYITGALQRVKRQCAICGEWCSCTSVTTVELPEGVKYEATIIMKVLQPGHGMNGPYLGIGCGCYAKFHRQVAHIQDAMKSQRS